MRVGSCVLRWRPALIREEIWQAIGWRGLELGVYGPSPSLIFRSQPKSHACASCPEPTHTIHPTKGSSPPSPRWCLTVSEEGGLQSRVRARSHLGCSECPPVPTFCCGSFLCPPP